MGKRYLISLWSLEDINNTLHYYNKGIFTYFLNHFYKDKVIERVRKRIFTLYKFVLSNSVIAKQNLTCF